MVGKSRKKARKVTMGRETEEREKRKRKYAHRRKMEEEEEEEEKPKFLGNIPKNLWGKGSQAHGMEIPRLGVGCVT